MELPEAKVVAGWIDRMIAILWVGALAWVTWQLGGFLPGTMVVGLPWICGLAGWVVLRWWVIVPAGAPRGWWYPLPLLAWVTCHMLWLAELPSRGMLHGWHMWSGLAAFWIGLHLARDPKLWRWALVGSGIVALGVVAAAIYQRVGEAAWLPLGRKQVTQYLGRSAGTFGNPNTMAAWLALVFGVASIWALKPDKSRGLKSRMFAGAIAASAMLGIGLSYSRGVFLALIVAGSLSWFFGGRGELIRRLGIITLVGAIAAGSLWITYQSNEQVQQRVDSLIEHRGERTRPLLWGIALALWQERPVVGFGGDSYGDLMERHRPEGLWESASYAHNEYINGLSDYGVIGAALGLLAVGLIASRRVQVETGGRGVGVALATLLIAVAVDFHLQAPAVLWLAAFLAGGWMATTGTKVQDRFTNRKHWTRLVAGAGVALVLWVLPLTQGVPRLQAEELRWAARESLDKLEGVGDAVQIRSVAASAVDSLRVAVAMDQNNESAWRDLSYALSLQHFNQPQLQIKDGVEAEAAAREALRASDLVAEHWLRLGVALDLQDRWAEAGPAFGRAVTLAPRQPVMWYYQAFHFSLKPATEELAKAALATCLRLDPWYDEAKLLQAELERTP